MINTSLTNPGERRRRARRDRDDKRRAFRRVAPETTTQPLSVVARMLPPLMRNQCDEARTITRRRH
jgi:hypothetical protein